jgi:hypothetical protein
MTIDEVIAALTWPFPCPARLRHESRATQARICGIWEQRLRRFGANGYLHSTTYTGAAFAVFICRRFQKGSRHRHARNDFAVIGQSLSA